MFRVGGQASGHICSLCLLGSHSGPCMGLRDPGTQALGGLRGPSSLLSLLCPLHRWNLGLESRPEQPLKFSSTFHPQSLQGGGEGPVLTPPGCWADHNKACVHPTPSLSQVHLGLQLRPRERLIFLRGPTLTKAQR